MADTVFVIYARRLTFQRYLSHGDYILRAEHLSRIKETRNVHNFYLHMLSKTVFFRIQLRFDLDIVV